MARTTNNSTKGRSKLAASPASSHPSNQNRDDGEIPRTPKNSTKGKSKPAASPASSHPSNQNRDDGETPRRNKNSPKGKSKLLDGDGTDGNTVGRPPKRRQPHHPESPPRKKSVHMNTEATSSAIETEDDQLIEAVLKEPRLIDALLKDPRLTDALLKRIDEQAGRADSQDQKRDQRDYNDIHKDHPFKKRRSNSRSPSPPRRSRQFRSSSPHSERSKAPLPPQEYAFNDPFMSNWKEFYTRARAIRDKGPYGRDLEERAKEEPVDLFNDSHVTRNAIDETFKKIEKEEPYSFPKDDDPTLRAACEALSRALQKASMAKAEHDTPEVKQALDNLRRAYDEAAESNTVSMRYIDVEPPYTPFSPLMPSDSDPLKRILLARSWVKELITGVRDESLGRRILVVGKPGSGKSVTLVGYLLFYLIAMGARIILQTESLPGIVGVVFDADGVRETSARDALVYQDNKPCYLLVSADGPLTSPLPALAFCTATIVVTSPNLRSKSGLNAWQKQAGAYQFVAPPPSCPEVVYLFPVGFHQLPDDETNMTIPSNLVTMERRNGSTSDHNIIFMTPRIFDIVVDVQQEHDWRFNWGVLNMYFRDPETRVAAGKKFEKMFLEKFRNDLSKMPPCSEMLGTGGTHPLSPLNAEAVAMPWHGLDRQPALERISVGKDANGNSYSKAELKVVIAGAMDNDSPPIRFLTPCAQNWPTWDAAVIRYAEENGKKAVHVIFLQTTIDPNRDILAKGLNQVRDAIPVDGTGPDVCYHYVLVLLVEDESAAQIPKWRDVLVSSKQRQKDLSWRPDNLRQYIMFIRMKGLFKQLLQD